MKHEKIVMRIINTHFTKKDIYKETYIILGRKEANEIDHIFKIINIIIS